MDKETRLRARAIRNLRASGRRYNENDILAEMSSLIESDEIAAANERQHREAAAAESRRIAADERRRREESAAASQRWSSRFRTDALQKLKSTGKAYDDADLELEIGIARERYDRAVENLQYVDNDDGEYEYEERFLSENEILSEISRLKDEESRESAARREELEYRRDLERRFRVNALRKLKASGKPYDDTDLEIAIEDCRVAYEAECSRRAAEEERLEEEEEKRWEEEKRLEKEKRAREIEAAIARGDLDPSDRKDEYSSLDTLLYRKRERDKRKGYEEAARKHEEARKKEVEKEETLEERWELIGTIAVIAAVIGAIIGIIYFLIYLYHYFFS